jgi:hypothetical protein
MNTPYKPDIGTIFAIEHLEAGDNDYMLVVLNSAKDGQDYADIAVRSSGKGNMTVMLEALHDKIAEALTQDKEEN